MCKQSIHRGDWRPFGDGNLWPLRSPLTCEPSRHKLLTTTTTIVNGVALHELWAWIACSHTHAHSHTQINTHTHAGIQQLPPDPLILHSQPLGPPLRGESGSIPACLVYWRWGYVLIRTMSHCHFDLTQGSSTGRYHTFVKYYLTPDISSIHV